MSEYQEDLEQPTVAKKDSSNYIPIDDVPEHDRDDLSSYSESERPRVSDPNNNTNQTDTTFTVTKTQNMKGAGNFMKDMVSMYQNGANDHPYQDPLTNSSPVKSKTLGQKDLGDGLGAAASQDKMQKTQKIEDARRDISGANDVVNRVVAQSNKQKKAPEREVDVKATTLGWNLEDESNGQTLKKSSTLGGVSSTVKDLYSMYNNGKNDQKEPETPVFDASPGQERNIQKNKAQVADMGKQQVPNSVPQTNVPQKEQSFGADAGPSKARDGSKAVADSNPTSQYVKKSTSPTPNKHMKLLGHSLGNMVAMYRSGQNDHPGDNVSQEQPGARQIQQTEPSKKAAPAREKPRVQEVQDSNVRGDQQPIDNEQKAGVKVKKRAPQLTSIGLSLTNMVAMYKNGQNDHPGTEAVAQQRTPEIQQQASRVEQAAEEPMVKVTKSKKKAEAVSSSHKRRGPKEQHKKKAKQEQVVQEEPKRQLPDVNMERNTNKSKGGQVLQMSRALKTMVDMYQGGQNDVSGQPLDQDQQINIIVPAKQNVSPARKRLRNSKQNTPRGAKKQEEFQSITELERYKAFEKKNRILQEQRELLRKREQEMRSPLRSRSSKKKSGHKYNQSFGNQVQENAYADANPFNGHNRTIQSNDAFQSPSQGRVHNNSLMTEENDKMYSQSLNDKNGRDRFSQLQSAIAKTPNPKMASTFTSQQQLNNTPSAMAPSAIHAYTEKKSRARDTTPSKKSMKSRITSKSNLLRPIKRIIADLFQTIAQQESQIERLRVELAQCKEFSPRALFNLIDEEQDNDINLEELQQYMFDNFIKHVSEKIVCEIITEFDSDQNGRLTYDEFLNIFMPAANESARLYCLNGRAQNGRKSVPSVVHKLASRILEAEKNLALAKIETRKELNKNVGFTIEKAFKTVAGRHNCITLQQLTTYLETEGFFFPKQHELEAIMRRCDHDGDRVLCFQEFAELCENPENPFQESEYSQSFASQRQREEFVQPTQSPTSGFELSEQRSSLETPQNQISLNPYKDRSSPGKKSSKSKSSSKNHHNGSPSTKIRKQVRNRHPSMSDGRLQNLVKFTSLLQKRLVLGGSLETQRQLLHNQPCFDSSALFNEIDSQNKGFIDAYDLEQFFQAGIEGSTPLNYSRIVEYLNSTNEQDSSDEKLSYTIFSKSLMPYKVPRGAAAKQMKFLQQYQQDEQVLAVQHAACKDSLHQVFKVITDLLPNRMQTKNFNPLTQLWSEVDPKNVGSVSVSTLMQWLEAQTGIQIDDSQINFINDCFNCKPYDQMITKDRFMAILN